MKGGKMEKSKKNSKAPPRYNEDIKKKCIELALKGMNVEEIVKTIKGPKQRAVMRYLRKAEVDIKR
jgi:hypothetical protein